MNELIEKLWKKFMCNPLVEGGYTKKDGFAQAIQAACKAQRNACLRKYQEEFNKRIYGSNSVISILTAEIEKQDYV